jgi:endonuclease III
MQANFMSQSEYTLYYVVPYLREIRRQKQLSKTPEDMMDDCLCILSKSTVLILNQVYGKSLAISVDRHHGRAFKALGWVHTYKDS